jgi:hypothetical protein
MQAGLAGRVEQNFHVALAVKGAAVADVVVSPLTGNPGRHGPVRALSLDHRGDIGGLGPAHPLFKWIMKRVPAGPRRVSSGSALGAIQRIAVFRPAPRSTQRPCTPPRSSGLSKRNSARPAEPALPPAMDLR